MKKKPTSRKPSKLKEQVARESTAPLRITLGDAVKAASHPVRTQILKTLKEAPSSPIELEEATGRSRYDLYHHLSVLEGSGLVEHQFRDGKTKEFYLTQPSRPDKMVMLFDEEDLKDNPKALEQLVEAAESLEGSKIPHKSKISGVQIIFSLPWSSED